MYNRLAVPQVESAQVRAVELNKNATGQGDRLVHVACAALDEACADMQDLTVCGRISVRNISSMNHWGKHLPSAGEGCLSCNITLARSFTKRIRAHLTRTIKRHCYQVTSTRRLPIAFHQRAAQDRASWARPNQEVLWFVQVRRIEATW
jgi:hypothetical protein